MKYLSVTIFLLFLSLHVEAQSPAGYVDPFIGTDRSDAPTVWGQYGGTYPGAVAPWGMVQLSPETRTTGENGYFHIDSTVYYFTCIGHSSGYPSGSHGSVQVMFGAGEMRIKKTETARPGYYTVTFTDNSRVEMTATTRTGIFRYKPVDNRAEVTIADAGNISISGDTVFVERNNGLFVFDQPWTNSVLNGQKLVLEFDRLETKGLLVKVAFSMVDMEGSRKNMKSENPGWDFEAIKDSTFRAWNDELSVVQIKSDNTKDLTKFYTALYHSFLLPNIISDTDGRYRGADRQVYTKEGVHEYGRFSTWDTFRSLHPLLCLLKPQRQKDMILSMLHLYDQRGYLPYTPMTGYHSIPVIVDSYLKGITAFDTEKAYQAMKKFLSGNEIPRPDTYKYIADGFLNDSIDESVSVTLDYAYNDWVLSVFAETTGRADEAAMFRQRSFNYRNLFDIATAFMLPRNASGFVRNPGEMGYKEADKWTASWFVPHNVQDLINLSGGDQYFIDQLHEAMQSHVIFDNEPVLHYPYLFSYAGSHDLTCYWVDRIRENCYTATPGGIPGNDDLGAMSGWFVFSAMGFFPVCPGRTEYVLTTPLFEEIVVRQDHGKEMKIITDPNAIHSFFSELTFDGKTYLRSWITHNQILEGGSLVFLKPESNVPDSRLVEIRKKFQRPSSLTNEQPVFHVENVKPANSKVYPHQESCLQFTVVNTGETGVFPAKIMDGTHAVAEKKGWVEQGETVTDSIAFRLYRQGKHKLSMSQFQMPVSVVSPKSKQPALTCNRITADRVVKRGEKVHIEIELQNISGKTVSQTVVLYDDAKQIEAYSCKLLPGEVKKYVGSLTIDSPGLHTLTVLDKALKIKVYEQPMESCVLDIDFDRSGGNTLWDASGFANHGTVVGEANWIEHNKGKALQVTTNSLVAFPLSESLDITGATISISAWVYPTNNTRGYIDFITKGDYIVFQTNGGQLSFFAGGWGRGTCTIPLPDNWLNNWHHVAGVCAGNELKLYLDGDLKQTIAIEGEIKKTEVPWNLGRNAEMPYSRRFEGMFGDVKIFREALTDQDINQLIVGARHALPLR